MPDLPTMTLSQGHYDRVVAAFPGTTAAQKVAAYRAWLTNQLIDFVERAEIEVIRQQAAVYEAEKSAEVIASLPPRQTFPPGSTVTPPYAV